MKIAIVEDEQEQARLLKSYIERYGNERQKSFEIHWFTDGLEFLESYQPNYHLVFMDIEMPYMNGMKVAMELRKIDADVCLVFVTNLAKYALKGYAVGATDYIVKPIVWSSFIFTMDRMMRSAQRLLDEDVFIQNNRSLRRISKMDIVYIESIGHKLVYHTATEGDIESWDSMKNVQDHFQDGFASPRIGVLVNLKYVRKIEGDVVQVGNYMLQIARPKKRDFINHVTMYLSEL